MSSGSFPPSEVTFHVPIARVLVQGLGRRGPCHDCYPNHIAPAPHGPPCGCNVVASAIFYGIVCWASSITDRDRRRMDRLVRRASSVLGCPLDSVEVVGNGRMMAKLSSLLNNTSHPLQDTLTALGSSFSERLLHPRCVKERALNTPKGCVLSPLLYSLFTHDCVATHSSNTIVRSVDDTTVISLITGDDERRPTAGGGRERNTVWHPPSPSTGLRCGESQQLQVPRGFTSVRTSPGLITLTLSQSQPDSGSSSSAGCGGSTWTQGYSAASLQVTHREDPDWLHHRLPGGAQSQYYLHCSVPSPQAHTLNSYLNFLVKF
ncbi:hypothetical protein L3Q82_017184, partial [Scortum barcoo]